VTSAHGTAVPAPGEHLYLQGETVTNHVISPALFGTTQYVATGWTMTGHEPSMGHATEFVFSVTNHAELTWLWSTQYWLTVESGPHGSVVGADGWREDGSTTEIDALPDAYYRFSHWQGDASGDANPLFLLMDESKSVTAYFAALNTTNHPTPQWWLAQHGITNDFEEAVNEDADGDTVLNWMEFVMDTDPTDATSFLAVADMHMAYGTNDMEMVWTNTVPPHEVYTSRVREVLGQLITWPVSTQRVYDVQSADGLSGEPWRGIPGLTNITPATPSLSITNPVTGEVLQHYRIEVRLPE
jgi:hypothetical protein